VAKQIVAATDGGAQASIDALGSRMTCEASVRCLRPRGRHVQVGLLLGDDSHPDLALARVLGLELSFHGSHGMPAAAYPAMLDEIATAALRPGRLVGRVISLAEAPDALVALGSAPVTSGMTVVDLARG